MKFRFLGAARTVTGSFHVVETAGIRFGVDCGLFQGPAEIRERNYQPFRIDPSQLSFMILTHAHIDHSGLIPKLCKQGFTGPIYCTHATADLVSILLPDSAHIQEMEVARKNRKAMRAGQAPLEPIYTVDDANNCLTQIQPVAYNQTVVPTPTMEFRLRDAGHILGSSMVEMWITEEGKKTKILFSGDLGNYSQRIIKDPTFIEEADILFLESTYGDRLHQQNSSRMAQLQEAIEFTYKKGGNLVIPAFAVERTQDLLYDLNVLYKDNKLPKDMKIFIDSPLAIAATEIFRHSVECYDDDMLELLREGIDPFRMPNLSFARTQEDSVRLNELPGKSIIISASGMCDAGRIKHHLKHNLWRPESTVLIVGYQAQGTLGRRLLEGEKKVKIHGEEVTVKADIRQIDSYSAHADQAGIVTWLKQFTTLPKRVFLVHGEEKSLAVLGDLIQQQFGVPVQIPNWLDEIEVEPVQLTAAPARVVEQVIEQEQAAMPQISKAIAAEEAYLRFCTKINKLFKENWESKNYDLIIRELETAEKILDEIA